MKVKRNLRFRARGVFEYILINSNRGNVASKHNSLFHEVRSILIHGVEREGGLG